MYFEHQIVYVSWPYNIALSINPKPLYTYETPVFRLPASFIPINFMFFSPVVYRPGIYI